MKIIFLVCSIGLVLAQTAAPPAPASPFASGIPDYVAHTGLVGLVLWFWRQDRTDRAAEKAEQEKRYADLAQDFRRIVTDNTQAIVSLREAILLQGKEGAGAARG